MSSRTIIDYGRASKTLDLADKVGQCFMAAAFINDPELQHRALEAMIAAGKVGGLCFFHSRASAATNFEGPKEVPVNPDSYARLRELIDRFQSAAPYPLLISIDAEWGLAMRVENSPAYPHAISLGAMENAPELVRAVGRAIGRDCREAGIHWNFAPVADINSNPGNPVIGYRSFGEERDRVTSLAAAYAAGLAEAGCLNCIKHFPGHGDTETDSHLALPSIPYPPDALRERELYPFRLLIEQGVDAIMVGHLDVPALEPKRIPATFSSTIIQGLLQEEMGFQGVVVSDALNMRALPQAEPGAIEARAFAAGNDLLCFPLQIEAGIQRILQEQSETRIESSFRKVWTLKEKVLRSDRVPGPRIETGLVKRLAESALTLLHGRPQDLVSFRSQPFRYLELGNKGGIFGEGIRSGMTGVGDASSPLLVGIFPPSMKPGHNFGIPPGELRTLRKLMEAQEVVIYHFGNPYALDLLDVQKAKALVVVYEAYPEFQQAALAHFKGRLRAPGKLPVTLKQQQHEKL